MFDPKEATIKTILLTGRQGCGKGTQAKLLSDATKWRVFSLGEKYRTLYQEQTPLGLLLAKTSKAGHPAPSWTASYLLQKELLEVHENEGLIIEGGGFRLLNEMKILEEVLADLKRPYVAINLEIPEEEAYRRLMNRGDAERRVDDDEERIRRRLAWSEEKLQPTIAYLREKGKVIDIDGMQSKGKVYKEIITKLGIYTQHG